MSGLQVKLFDHQITVDYGAYAPKQEKSTLKQQQALLKYMTSQQGRAIFDKNKDNWITTEELGYELDHWSGSHGMGKQAAKAGFTKKALVDLIDHFDQLIFGNIDAGGKAWFALSQGDITALATDLKKGDTLGKQAARLRQTYTKDRHIKVKLPKDRKNTEKVTQAKQEAFRFYVESMRGTVLKDPTRFSPTRPDDQRDTSAKQVKTDFLERLDSWIPGYYNLDVPVDPD